jgi:hypothetical protein
MLERQIGKFKKVLERVTLPVQGRPVANGAVEYQEYRAGGVHVQIALGPDYPLVRVRRPLAGPYALLVDGPVDAIAVWVPERETRTNDVYVDGKVKTAKLYGKKEGTTLVIAGEADSIIVDEGIVEVMGKVAKGNVTGKYGFLSARQIEEKVGLEDNMWERRPRTFLIDGEGNCNETLAVQEASTRIQRDSLIVVVFED